MTTELTRDQIINLISPSSKNSAHHDIAFASRVIDALLALTQRPAAQEVDELPEIGSVWQHTNGNRYTVLHIANEFTQDAARYPKMVVYQGTANALVWARAASDWRRSMTLIDAPQQATPEPVGEVHQFPPLPEGWPARFRCDSCDGNGEIGELVSMGDFQPPERQTCPDCGGRGWTSEEPAFNAEHMREFAEAHARNTRLAPGVPEGFALVPVEPTKEMIDRACADHGYPGGNRWIYRGGYKSMLAAAQAK